MESEISSEIFNIGNPSNVVKITKLAEMIRSYCKSKSKLKFIDPKILIGDNYCEGESKLPIVNKIKGKIGWSPSISLHEIITDAIKRHRKSKNNK